jgi:MFS family permease
LGIGGVAAVRSSVWWLARFPLLGDGAASGVDRGLVFSRCAAGAVEAPTWTTAVELGGRRGGTAAGICNTGGNAGGILSPVLTPVIGEYFGWRAAILVGAVVCVVGAALWLGVDPRERLPGEGG